MSAPNLTEAAAAAQAPALPLSVQVENQLQPALSLFVEAKSCVPGARLDYDIITDRHRMVIVAALSAYPAAQLTNEFGGDDSKRAGWIVSKFNDTRAVPARTEPLICARFTFDASEGNVRFRYMSSRNFAVTDTGYGEGGALVGAMNLADAKKVLSEQLKQWQERVKVQPQRAGASARSNPFVA